MKNKSDYDEFVDKILSLPGDSRGDLLRIAGKESNNPYLYLYESYWKSDSYHGYLVRGLFQELNILH
jgi:hypothetical protein